MQNGHVHCNRSTLRTNLKVKHYNRKGKIRPLNYREKKKLNTNKRGSGTWKMNIMILDDKPIQKHITRVIQETHKNCDNLPNQIPLEICKIKIKEE